ncbi:hypothetical protein [Mycobacterium asiaticum]|uniref:hypothetical protein n=1 Tax=Mycobacterium asiaticum TaxID=1790 RepID=UPI0007EFDB36|nr:hypothetical protein [Mycobacterium asiaticum]OBJ50199.1 hypothetical protein A9W94_28515 [Mycobacterium asiaticum]
MTEYRIKLRDCSIIGIHADELTSRTDGSLWALRHTAPPVERPSAIPRLTPLLVLAAREWMSVWPADTANPFTSPDDDDTKTPPPAPAPPKLLVQAQLPDPLGRRQAIAERLATLNPES